MVGEVSGWVDGVTGLLGWGRGTPGGGKADGERAGLGWCVGLVVGVWGSV